MTLVDEAGRQRVSDAISKAETTTSGEIVAVVAADSSSYLHVPFMWAALVALLVPWPLIHFTWMTVQSIWLLQLAVFAVLLAVLFYRPVRYALVPRSTKRQRAHRRAVEQFLAQNLHTTEGRTGVLVFVSAAERYAEVLADAAIHRKVPEAEWQAIVDALTTAIGEGRAVDGFVAAVDAIGKRLAQHFPPGSADRARLPNHLIVLE
jgi:putative membrane protein